MANTETGVPTTQSFYSNKKTILLKKFKSIHMGSINTVVVLITSPSVCVIDVVLAGSGVSRFSISVTTS
jgi:hypothetical protein